MRCPGNQHDYPGLQQFLHLASKDWDHRHPIIGWMKSDHLGIREMLQHMEHCTQRVLDINPGWMKSKANKLMRDKTEANLSSILAEVRAYYDLVQAWGRDHITARPDEIQGSDFSIGLNNDVLVEVQTPDISNKKYRIFEIRRWENGVISIQATKDPRTRTVGVPKRGIETNQGELALKISRIKDQENQFDDHDLSILWLDFGDPTKWRRGIEIGQALPLIFGGNSLTSGYLWYAFYAAIGDPIFDAVAEHSPKSAISRVDSAGRFNDDTRIDVAIISTASYKVAFQNHLSRKKFPPQLFDGISRLPNINLPYSWIEMRAGRSLKQRIEDSKEYVAKFASDFTSTDDVIARRAIMDDAIRRVRDAEIMLQNEQFFQL